MDGLDQRGSVRPARRVLRVVLALLAVFAVSTAAIEVVDEPRPVAAWWNPYDPNDPYNWNDNMDIQKWADNALVVAYGFVDVIGAHLKDRADGRVWLGSNNRFGPDALKYGIQFAAVLIVVVITIILDLIDQEDSYETLLAKNVQAIAERVNALQDGINQLDQELSSILAQTHMASYRIRHTTALVMGSASTQYYKELWQALLPPVEAGDGNLDLDDLGALAQSGNSVELLASEILAVVPTERNYLREVLLHPTVGESLLITFGKTLNDEPDRNADDRSRYGSLYEYAAFWTARLNDSCTLIQEAKAHEQAMLDPVVDVVKIGQLQSELEALAAECAADATKLHEMVGHPVANEEYALAGDLVIRRNGDAAPAQTVQASATPNADLHDSYSWSSMTRSDFDELMAVAAYGEGDTPRQALASLDVHVPAMIRLADGDGTTDVDVWKTWGEGTQNETLSRACSWYGFTEDVTGERGLQNKHWLFGWQSAGFRGSSDYTFYAGQTRCVSDLQQFGQTGDKAGDYRLTSGTRVHTTERREVANLRTDDAAATNLALWHALPTNSFALGGSVEIDVYRDGVLVDTFGEPRLFTPGYIEEITLTTDPAAITSTGWTMVADGGRGTRFGGVYHGSETTKIELAAGAHSLIYTYGEPILTSFDATVGVECWHCDTRPMTAPDGTGAVLSVDEDLIDVTPIQFASEAGPGTGVVTLRIDQLSIPNDDGPISDVSIDGVLSVGSPSGGPATDFPLDVVGGAIDHVGGTITLEFDGAGGWYRVDLSVEEDLLWAPAHPSFLTIDAQEGGAVVAVLNGEIIAEIDDDLETIEIPGNVRRVVFTDDLANLTQAGLIVVATGDQPSPSWSGDHSGSGTDVIPIHPGDRLAVTAEFN